jgi:hypothetical protein
MIQFCLVYHMILPGKPGGIRFSTITGSEHIIDMPQLHVSM